MGRMGSYILQALLPSIVPLYPSSVWPCHSFPLCFRKEKQVQLERPKKSKDYRHMHASKCTGYLCTRKCLLYLVSFMVFLNSLVIGALYPPFLSKESMVWIWSHPVESRPDKIQSITCKKHIWLHTKWLSREVNYHFHQMPSTSLALKNHTEELRFHPVEKQVYRHTP